MSMLKNPLAKGFTSIHRPWPESLLDGGEMSERIYRYDWSETQLGPIRAWPQSLRAVVNMILANSFPMIILWGPEYIQFYNDAFIPIAGHNHPQMLGAPCREIWSEIWDSILTPIFTRVGESRKSILIPNQHFPVLRFGYLEEVYCLTAYSALLDDNGDVGGIMMTISETTGQVLGERRLKLLRDLGARSSEARTPREACRIVTETMAQSSSDIPFALIYLLDQNFNGDGPGACLAASAGIQPGGAESPEVILLTDEETSSKGWPLMAALNATLEAPANTPFIRLDDLEERFGPMPGGPWPETSRTAVILPIASQTQEPIGFLVAGISPRRELDSQYSEFLALVTAQVATAISNAQAYEQEKKRAEALAELDRAKTTFFSNVSHEFRTPLTLMLGPLEEMLGHTDTLPPEDRQHVDIVYRNGLRLLRLVNSLLDFSRLEAGRVQANYQPTDLAQFTSELASVFRSTVEKGGLSYLVDCPPLSAPVYVDREMWEKIVLNLISNAFKFTFTGEIAVTQIQQDDQILLSVRDTGTGIAPDQLSKVFERFHRVKDSKSRTYEGTGIGLSLVQELVKLHGGTITVKSTPGEGTVFRVSIPAGCAHLPTEKIRPSEKVRNGATQTAVPANSSAFVEEAMQWLPQEDTPSRPEEIMPGTAGSKLEQAMLLPGAESLNRQRIVLADDNSDMLSYVKRLLLPYYDVVAVPDGEAALSAVREAMPDLVLTDVMMPRLDGFGLLHEIRQDPKTRMLPVIMLSARAGEEANIEGLEAGADDYLVKPFSARELLARVRSNLEMARIRREAEEAMLQAQKMQVIGQLAGGVAHDFNSLLTVLVGNLSWLSSHVPADDESGRRILGTVNQAVSRISNLTRQLLAFARKQHLRLESMQMNQLIQGMEELFNRTLGGMVQVVEHLAPDLWTAEVDKSQMELAILNLLINARDAMPEGGTVILATRNESLSDSVEELEPGDYVVISVSDTGTGMNPEVLSKAFEPFFTTKDIGKGTGLGLSQVYGLAKQMGGLARIQSVQGQGTCVEIYLPRTGSQP